MRHEQQCHAAVDEELLHPLHGRDVEVVRRLVEQQQVGLAHEGSGQERLSLPPAGRRGEGCIGVESEVQQHRLHLAVDVPRARGIQRTVQPVELAQRGLAPLRLHAMAGLVIARKQLARLAQPRRDHVEDGALDVLRNLLLQPRDGDTRLPGDAAAVWHQGAVEQLHQGALARAVPPEEAHALTALDREGWRDRAPGGPPKAIVTSCIPSKAMAVSASGHEVCISDTVELLGIVLTRVRLDPAWEHRAPKSVSRSRR